MELHPRFHPIIYVRGFAMRDSDIEHTVHTPYMGFNTGSTRIRQGPAGEVVRHLFESPLIRLMKDYGYRDLYADGQLHTGPVPQRSILIHRYYESPTGALQRPSIEEAAADLGQAILRLRDQVCGQSQSALAQFRVYLVAHSMGGLVCRCLLQNPTVADVQARGCVDGLFTYGTPHNGIEVAGMHWPTRLGAWDIRNFHRDEMARYLSLPDQSQRVDDLSGALPPERVCSLVGTNHQDYSLARLAVGAMSDGLVKLNNASVAGAPRVFVHQSHSGHYGMVNSEAGYQNLSRFLFGDLLVKGTLITEALPLPPSVARAHQAGQTVQGSYYFEAKVTPRQTPAVPLSDRRVETGSAILRRYDELFHPERAGLSSPRYPCLFSVFLDTRRIETGKTLVFALDLAVLSTDFSIDGHWYSRQRIPDEYLYRNTLVIRATCKHDDWQLRYVQADSHWGESRGKPVERDATGWYIALQTAKGFKARLRLEFVAR